MTLYFITGAEGVGKTTLVNFLKNNLPDFEVYDFDEVGVPENPSLQWRHDTTQHWINTAIKNKEDGKSTIVIGLSFPNEIESFKENKKLDEIKFLLMDISEEEREKRLLRKNAPKELIEDTNQLIKLREEFKDSGPKKRIIDVTNLSKDETEEKVLEWVLS